MYFLPNYPIPKTAFQSRLKELEADLEDARRDLYHGATETWRKAAKRQIELLEEEIAEMTNRLQYTDTIIEPSTKEEEITLLTNLLAEMGQPLTLQNAGELLALGLQNAPDQWLLSLDDLAVLWPQMMIEQGA